MTMRPAVLMLRLTDCLTPFDTNVIASTEVGVAGGEAEGFWVVSSPNAEWVPGVMFGVREVFQRADGRFGWEDRTLWPQFYSFGFHYICCIPQQPAVASNPLSILWWTPQNDDFIPLLGSEVDVVLGRLPAERVAALERWRDSLVLEVREYQTCHKHDELLGMLTTAMRHAFLRFTIAPMTRRQMTENVPNFQRFCLDIRAYLDYHNIFLPRLAAPDDETAAIPVSHDVMGAITHDDTTVMELYKMRIPVWHVRPTYKLLPHMNIRRVTHLSTPRNMVTRHY